MFRIPRNNNSSPPARAVALLRSCRVESVESLFEDAMNIGDRLVGSRSRECVEQRYQTRLAAITHGAFAIWLNPFGMLDAKLVVNLLPKLGAGEDLVRHGNWFW
jgi:hypothetical protein